MSVIIFRTRHILSQLNHGPLIQTLTNWLTMAGDRLSARERRRKGWEQKGFSSITSVPHAELATRKRSFDLPATQPPPWSFLCIVCRHQDPKLRLPTPKSRRRPRPYLNEARPSLPGGKARSSHHRVLFSLTATQTTGPVLLKRGNLTGIP